MTRRARIALIALGAALLLFALDTGYEAFKTLRRLDAIEAERDTWQRPAEILQALNLVPGDVAVDFGSGSGYFSLKMASAVGPSGRVRALDVRRLSLAFLWARTFSRRLRNIEVVHVEPDDSQLAAGSADAVLVLNTYHELTNRPRILDRVFRALVSGGRLVVVDPVQTEQGRLPSTAVAAELRESGFEVVTRDDSFIASQAGTPWWLIVARKP